MSTQWGTSHFVSLDAARTYYKRQGESADSVDERLTEGAINIGPPTLREGETLIMVDDGLRYAIQEPSKQWCRERFADQRSLYMSGQITFAEFYLWLGEFIGVRAKQLPVSLDRIRASTDEHLNDIPLNMWDRQDHVVRQRAYAKGLAWSQSDTVCVLKALARKLASEG